MFAYLRTLHPNEPPHMQFKVITSRATRQRLRISPFFLLWMPFFVFTLSPTFLFRLPIVLDPGPTRTRAEPQYKSLQKKYCHLICFQSVTPTWFRAGASRKPETPANGRKSQLTMETSIFAIRAREGSVSLTCFSALARLLLLLLPLPAAHLHSHSFSASAVSHWPNLSKLI